MGNLSPEQAISGLRQLWKLAFGDTDAFLDGFFGTAFSFDRCRWIEADHRIVAALYWFDCRFRGEKLAYLYAVATHPDYRGRGLCRKLMADTHDHLQNLGYGGILLVPQEEGLRKMYAAMGYADATKVSEFSCEAGTAVSMQPVDAQTYGMLRRRFLPEGGVIQEGENLRFLASYASFYAGEDFLLAASGSEGIELLGNREKAPGILSALGLSAGRFRSPGGEKPYAMFLALREGIPTPDYFGFAFD